MFMLCAMSLFGETVGNDYLMGMFEPRKDNRFVLVDMKYTSIRNSYLRTEAYDAFKKMVEQAKTEGIQLKIVSATRNFNSQKSIWNAKWEGFRLVNGKNLKKAFPNPSDRAIEILKFSAMPGASRHHWGTDIDLNSVSPAYFDKKKGKTEYEWLIKNAHRYGFYQPYTARSTGRTGGHEEEKWHWSYIPLSKDFYQQYISRINYSDFTGFSGSESAGKIQIILNYVRNINPDCQ